MQREEKALEAALEAMISRLNDMRTTLASLLRKLDHEYENINWPTMLDSYALLSSQMNTFLKVLKNDKTPNLRNLIALPIRLCPDRDEELAKLTEKRVNVFNHEVVPDYLRTKPDPDVEQREQQLFQRSNQIPPDQGQKQVNNLNKIVNQTLELISNARDQWENEVGSRTGTATASSLNDTQLLISAVCLGKGLKTQMKMAAGQPPPMQVPTTVQTQQSSAVVGPGLGKVPSAIKTNIKAAASIHPYSR